ncbi:ATP-dependent Zn protease (plasmid) [Peteryoungia desertarenae]|uniref:ATP-dependent Zn protease n=1 Tax=Peteryoungia desertarenae TaxID=1813451 RepID=A0ABX6QSU7_9HYPH|nr:ATP-dependent Zn protease [Peteryoungia desertarenae]QLF71674.1 ATP-dependent Zn protease [Peteryoungia desertarenae]
MSEYANVVSHQSSRQGADLAPLNRLALLACGRTGADIERLVRELRQKTRRERRPITWADIETALMASRIRLTDDHRYRLAVHEVGHAMAYTLLETGTVYAVTVGGSLNGASQSFGQVEYTPLPGRPQNDDWLMRTCASSLAGRTAELLVFGETLAGSGGDPNSDLARATRLMLAAETQLGFSDINPLIYVAPEQAQQQLLYDTELRNRVDARLKRAEAMAMEMLTRHRMALTAIAAELADIGVMSGDEFRKALAPALTERKTDPVTA